MNIYYHKGKSKFGQENKRPMTDTNADLYTLQPRGIVLYGSRWCPDCVRARSWLKRNGYTWLDIDIDADPRAAEFVRQVNRGNRSVPTICLPNGNPLVEPSDDALAERLGGKD